MTDRDPFPFITAEYHREAWRVMTTGPEPEPMPGDPGYVPDPSEYME